MSRTRPIVIGIAIRGDRILAIEGVDTHKGEHFFRPPGGGIDFGETSEAAVRREFQEELNVEVTPVDYLGALESAFTYEGRPGHEIVLVHRVELADDERFGGDTVAGVESDGAAYTARWLPLADVRTGSAILYPDGLLALLDGVRTFPEFTLETPRLTLRPYQPEDAPDVALACRDELTQRWLPLPNPYTDADALAWCTEMAPRFRMSGEGIEWAAIRQSDGRLIGSFGLKRTDWRGRSSEIGYWVAPWARGEGLAVEATLAIARWLLLEQGFERMVLRAATGNVESQRVAQKAGFVREGVARNAGFTNSGRVDLVVFSLVRSDLVDGTDDAAKTRAWYRALPAKRIGAGVLYTDGRGHVLLVRPTYKDSWEIPGGMVEEAESPHEAAAREVAEELGVDLPVRALLCVDWVPPRDPKTDGLMFVFDGGTLGTDDLAGITLPADELREHRFVEPEALGEFLPERIARRLVAALAARDARETRYLADGHAIGER